MDGSEAEGDTTIFRDPASRIRALEETNKALQIEFESIKLELETQHRRRKDAENRLSINPVTGLPTHYQLDFELAEILDRCREEKSRRLAIVIVQLNSSYDMIKRTLKSSVTEWLIYQIAMRFKESLGTENPIFQTRENEFILIIGYRELAELEETIQRCMQRHNEPHIFSGFNLSLSCNAGIALFPLHGSEKGVLLHRADIALGASIEKKRGFVFYEENYEASVIERMELQNSIIKAIEEPALKEIGSQFTIHFQPKVVIESIASGRIKLSSIGAEALIRWNHPKRGMMSPDKFINIAEETGLIMPIGKWLFFQVAKKMNQWREAGLAPIDVSINLSPRQFRSSEVAEVFQRLIETESLDPRRITIEVTETSLFEDPTSALINIDRFKSMGFLVSVDDFGTGYSSLSHLHRYPIDEIKIDKSFIRHYPQSKRDTAIVDSLASIAKQLGIGLIAEGVERYEQLERLHSVGCAVQGYIFSHPLPEEDFLAWVAMVQGDGMVIDVLKE
jgi:EAL domain-containing protein (putative c-di-GMP-specific phosphodiesterase class I)/GGDEF domain-containing protein